MIGPWQVSSRDRLTMLALPALCLIIAYSYGFARVKNARQKVLFSQLTIANTTRPSSDVLAQRLAIKNKLVANLYTIQHDQEVIRRQLVAQLDEWQNQGRHLASGEALAALWQRHQIILLEQSPMAVNTSGAPALVDRLRQQSHLMLNRSFEPTLWEIRLQGEFSHLRFALEEILANNWPLIPANLVMHPKPQSKQRYWTIQFWQ